MSQHSSDTSWNSPGGKAVMAKASAAYTAESRQAEDDARIVEYLPLVRHVVQKISASLPRHIDSDDLMSAGTLGLVRASRRFDADKKVDFKTYAYICIRGAVIDELRHRSFVSTNIHHQIRKVRDCYQHYISAHGEPPSDEDLAARTGLTAEQLYRVLQEARRQNFLSIHGLTEEQPALGSLTPADDGPSPVEQAERQETLERLAVAIRQLPERDRVLLILYYERDLTMKEIAEVLTITESRVSQLHASAVFKLSMKMRSAS